MAEYNVRDVYDVLPDKITVIGKKGIAQRDILSKADGTALYTRDIKIPGMVYAKFYKSPYPHARIVSMDTTKAEAIPGVRHILRWDDNEYKESLNKGVIGSFIAPQWVLIDTAIYEGMWVGALVCADTPDICDDALAAIEIEWEEFDFVIDAIEAEKEGAPLVLSGTPDEAKYPTNSVDFIAKYMTTSHGDTTAGFAEADQIIEWESSRKEHVGVGPEPTSVITRWRGDYLEAWIHTQDIVRHKKRLANFFNIPMGKVIAHLVNQGAGFGAMYHPRENMASEICGAIVSRRLGRPVQTLQDRREDFDVKSEDIEPKGIHKVGFKNDGTITAVQGEAWWSQSLQAQPMLHITEATKIPNIQDKNHVLFTNIGKVGSIRCEKNQSSKMISMVFNHVAASLGMDPTEVALKNDGAEGRDHSYWADFVKNKYGIDVKDSLKLCIQTGKNAIDWDKKWHAPNTKKLPNGKMHGMAFNWDNEWGSHRRTTAACGLKLDKDGKIVLMYQRSDTGLHDQTTYAQVIAQDLGAKLEDVWVINQGQDDCGFYACPPTGARGFVSSAPALRDAANKLKKMILEYAVTTAPNIVEVGVPNPIPALFPDRNPEELDIENSEIFLKADPEQRRPLSDLAKDLSWGSENNGYLGFSVGPQIRPPLFAMGYSAAVEKEEGHIPLCRQAHFMEVEVDTETGQVEVTNLVVVNDVGFAVSPETCNGQQYGGAYMAMGRGLSEEVIYDGNLGVMLNGNLMDYHPPTSLDVGPVSCHLVETGNDIGPYHSTGIGEPPATLLPCLPSAAIYNAIGKFIDDYPITPDKVLKAIGKA